MKLGNTEEQSTSMREWCPTGSDVFRASPPSWETIVADWPQQFRRRRRAVSHSTTSSITEWPGLIGIAGLVADRRGIAARRMTDTKIIVITRKVRTRMAPTWQSAVPAGFDRTEFMKVSPQPTPSLVFTMMTTAGEQPYHRRLSGPIWFFEKLLNTWQLDRSDAVPLLGLEPSDLSHATDVLAGRATLRGRDAKDRIAYLFRIRKTLFALFGDEDVENEWLRERHEMLDDKAPMDLLREGSMENLLLVKEYVEAAAGR